MFICTFVNEYLKKKLFLHCLLGEEKEHVQLPVGHLCTDAAQFLHRVQVGRGVITLNRH